ncbi:MAG: hypothetical protein EOR85_13090 [Mesorhizobium sp.]|uniref:hypothetical protein n=1 Tax=Mesorhizobium sp. TaxID=1871066 RepID=UPI000FE9191E|nr:hypothetical protein [Mesorhizobium sp.]RWK61779.1 MAG: hypothetical protein EOR49_15945 [Mesorhizobium sp.]RWM47702.1 MAG: hypothetical protein EOR76_14415 [Mesorhizobium sp.]RWN02434.1 MAG: hypothetical protein EOR85_13090 [Mesorhizobium sp.]
MSHNAILEVPVLVVSGPAGQSFLVVQSAAALVADFGRDGDRAIIRATGDEWLKTAGVWAATGENFVLAQGAVQVEAATAAASAAQANADATASDRVQTGADRTQTTLDRAATGADAGQTAADHIATGADRVQTALDRVATSADRIQTELDRTAAASSATAAATNAGLTAADRIATAADVVATGENADRAETAEANALVLAGIYKTTAAGIAATTNGKLFGVYAASSANIIDIYENAAGVAVATGRSYPSASIFQESRSFHLGKVADPVNAVSGSGTGTFRFADPVLYRVPLTSFKMWFRTVTTVKLKQLRLDIATGNFNEIASVVLTPAGTGLRSFTPANFGDWVFEAGDYLGFSHTTALGHNAEAFPANGLLYVGAGDLAPVTTYTGPNAAGFTYQVNADFGGQVQMVSTASYNAQQAVIDKLVGNAPILIGRQSTPVVANGTSANYTHIQNTPAPHDSVLKEFSIAVGSGLNAIIYLRKYTRSGSPGAYTFTPVASVFLRNRNGLGVTTFTPADFGHFPVAKGEYLGCWAPTSGGKMADNAVVPDEGDGFYQVAGEANPIVTTTPITAYRMQYQFKLVRDEPAATAEEFDALEERVSALEIANDPASTLLAYGDSMTAGHGGTAYPTQLAALLGRTVTNHGVGSQRSPDIFARWGSFPILVPALTIPTSGSVDFTVTGFNGTFDQANPITDNNSATTLTGFLAGIPGVLSRVSGTYPGSYVYRFTRTGSGAAVPVIAGENFFIDMSDARDYATPIFWVGRNSIGLQNISGQGASEQFDKVIAWHERAISFLKSLNKRFLIMGPSNRNDEYSGSATTVAGAALNGSQSYDVIVQIENEMRQKWPKNFVNQRGYLVSRYDPGTPQDVIDHGRDVPPSTKRADLLHYNTSGYGDVAAYVGGRITQLGY